MNDKKPSHFKIPEKIRIGLQLLESGQLFLLELKEALTPYLFSALQKSKYHFKQIMAKLTKWDFCFGLLSLTLMISSFLVFLSGFCVLFYQVFTWLQSGVWGGLPLLKIFNYFFDGTALQSWVHHPDSYLGLHQIVSWILENSPVSLILILNGIAMTAFFGIPILMIVCYRLYTLSSFQVSIGSKS